MFLLYRVFGKTREIVEDCIPTVSEARAIAWQSGPGRYAILSLRRPPGHRVVERLSVPEPEPIHDYYAVFHS